MGKVDGWYGKESILAGNILLGAALPRLLCAEYSLSTTMRLWPSCDFPHFSSSVLQQQTNVIFC